MAAEAKTKPTKDSVAAFVKKVPDAQKRADAAEIIALMKDATGEEPVMWGPSIVGFGQCHYKYESGREGDMPITGFSPRKQSIVVYLAPDFDAYAAELKKLGPHTSGKSCLYFKRIADIDRGALKKIIEKSVARTKKAMKS